MNTLLPYRLTGTILPIVRNTPLVCISASLSIIYCSIVDVGAPSGILPPSDRCSISLRLAPLHTIPCPPFGEQ